MILCFGTYASVINCCRQNISQTALIARIVKVVDPESRYIGENRFKIIEQEKSGQLKEKIEGDKPTASKLLSCKMNFIFSDENVIHNLDTMAVIENFKKEVVPFICEDKKIPIILALLDIIRRDKCLGSENEESFKKYFGVDKQCLLQQSKFVFHDFLGRILLYTVCGIAENINGRMCVKTITDSYIDGIAKLYAYEYQWDVSTQTATLAYKEILNFFHEAILKFEIKDFVEKIDPTNMMEFEWVELCDDFTMFVKQEIHTLFEKNCEGMMSKKIQEFAQILDDYTLYLGRNMRPIIENPEIFVPLYRDENAKWALAFGKTVMEYRQRLISVYQEIYYHVIPDEQESKL